ncbi:MAG: choice-of-anchor B family protein [Phycisphaerae bacterium]
MIRCAHVWGRGLALVGISIASVVVFPGAVAAEGFPAFNVTLLGRVDLGDFPDNQSRGSDIWAYVSPSGREYAIVGLQGGTAFVEVTDPTAPNVVGYIDGPNSIWRDMRVLGEYAYMVSEEGNGLQIADLTRIDDGIVTLANNSHLNGFFNKAHNISVNVDSGYAYLVLTDLAVGLIALDLSNPVAPQIAGVWNVLDLHDVQVHTYTSGKYAGREIAFGFGEENGLQIIDVTVKSNMVTLSSLLYPNTTYCHQGWLSDDMRYVFIGDELDEISRPGVTTTTTYVVDVSDLEHPQFVTSFSTGLPAIDHNLMVRGNHVFEANYSSGLRVFDFCDINNVQQVAFFDTHPENDNRNFDGAWGTFARLPSGIIMVSDRDRGLFVFDVVGLRGCTGSSDWDGDGDVDIRDYAQFKECAGGQGVAAGSDCDVFDADGDEDVDLGDFGAMQIRFTGTKWR